MTNKNVLLIVTGVILILMGLFLAIGGIDLITLDGSYYYLIAGLSLIIIGTLIAINRKQALPLYGLFLFGSTLWALWEVGLSWWELVVPRLWVWFVVGFILLLPWWWKPLQARTQQPRFPLLLSAAMVIAALTIIAPFFTSPKNIKGVIDNPLAEHINPDQIAADDWPAYGGTNAGLHYSALDQITPKNVHQLQEAWRIQTGDMPSKDDPIEITNENTPLKVNDLIYACTPHSKVLALVPETGEIRWQYDPRISLEGAENFTGWAHMTCRGVSYYDADKYLTVATTDTEQNQLDQNQTAQNTGNQSNNDELTTAEKVSSSSCPRRIILPTADARLIALNADTGELCTEFGENGAIDLSKNIGPYTPGGYYSTSPAVVTRDLIIIGAHVTDDESTDEPSGVVRAFDVSDGRLVWNWDSTQPDNTEPIAEDGIYPRNSANVWSIMSADEKLGMVYLPMGNQTPDQYGAERTDGAERFSAGIVALDIATGKVRWNYQFTRHDLWDMDVPAQPVLVDLQTQMGIEPAVIQPTKQGSLYVLNRETGEPIVPIHDIATPQGAVEGDWTAKTQPRSALNLLRPDLTEKDMWGSTPFDQLSCRIDFKSLRYEGQYTPPSLEGSIVYPGNVGVFNWMGIAVDPQRQLIFTPANYMSFTSQLVPAAEVASGAQRASEGQGLQLNRGLPYAVIMKPFLSRLGFPCQAPSWGDVAGISLTDYSLVWKHHNGTSRDSTPIIPMAFPVGVPSMGGPITTAGGVAFMSGTLDQYLRAYNVANGKELWKARLPAGGQATPMTYKGKDGRQYVLLVVGGHGSFGSQLGDYIIAYALPEANN